MRNITTGNKYVSFHVPLPTNRGGLKLYISRIRVGVNTADSNNYVDYTYLYLTTYNTKSLAFSDTTNLSSQQEKLYDPTDIDCSGYKQATIRTAIVTDTIGNLVWGPVEVEYYYDT